MPYNLEFEKFRTWWRRARPSTQGFRKCYQAKTPAGDLLQLEANLHEGLVKFQLEPVNEKGACYTATVKKGMIIREREVNTGVSLPLKRKFEPFREIFSAIPDEEILKCVSGVYGIVWLPHNTRLLEEQPSLTLPQKETKKITLLKKFLKTVLKKKEEFINWKDVKENIQDSALGLSLGSIMYYQFLDFVVVGWVLAFYGILSGGVDWILRKKRPRILKVLFFLGFGTYFFYTGYTLY